VHLPGHAEHRPGLPFQHLEKRYFEIGDLGFPVWRTMGGIMGMAICNDRRWPEVFRVMGLQGVELVMIGYNTPTYNIYHPEPPHLRTLHNQLSLQSGAYQNGTWVVGVAKGGAEDGFEMIAGSCIVAPTGEIVAQALTDEDELVFCDCDLALGDYIKSSVFNFEKHRRVEHYRRIVEQTGVIRPD
jgi:predicted amidohydrolase